MGWCTSWWQVLILWTQEFVKGETTGQRCPVIEPNPTWCNIHLRWRLWYISNPAKSVSYDPINGWNAHYFLSPFSKKTVMVVLFFTGFLALGRQKLHYSQSDPSYRYGDKSLHLYHQLTLSCGLKAFSSVFCAKLCLDWDPRCGESSQEFNGNVNVMEIILDQYDKRFRVCVF